MQKIRLSIALFATLILIGCGGTQGLPTCYVEGIVTLDGSPLDGALVTFYPETPGESTRSATGYSNELGKYALTSDGGEPQKGALEGNYMVTVLKYKVEATAPQSSSSSGPGPSSASETSDSSSAKRTMITPQVYTSTATSPLKATVQKGKNDIPFALESK